MKQISNLLVIGLFFCTTVATAQHWEIGAGLNAHNYQGDVVEPSLFTLKETNPNFGIFGRRTFSNDKFAVRLGLTLGRISGDDTNFDDPSWRQTRKFNFKSPLTEIAAMLEWQPMDWAKDDGSRRKIVPYFFGGLGVALTNPTTDFNEPTFGGTNGDRVAQDKRDLTKTAVAFPLGAGFRMPVGPGYLGLEAGFRPTTSDYLDGISEAGNPDKNDWYVIGGINYSYRFGGSNSVDTDGDGVIDSKDKCPNVPGAKDNMGCPGDRDKDGISDAEDKCPDLAGDKLTGGCPAISVADKAIITNAISNINFKTASADLEDSSLPILDKVADVLRRYPYYQVSIEGHTDSQGDDAANLTLSQNRAKTCYNYLLSKGVETMRMQHKGFGETRPVASNDTDAGRRQNRRVEFVLTVK